MDTFIVWANGSYPKNLDESKYGKCGAFRGDCCRLEVGDEIRLGLNYENAGAKNIDGELCTAKVKKIHYSIAFAPNEFKSEIQQIVYIRLD